MMYLNEVAVHALLKPPELVNVLREAFVSDIQSPQRTHHHIPGSDSATMLLMPAWRPSAFGVKVLTIDPVRTQMGFPSIDGLPAHGRRQWRSDGRHRSSRSHDRSYRGRFRSCRIVSRPEASTLLMVGTGNLAPFVIEAHCSVRSYRRVLIWGRDRQKAESVRDQITAQVEVEIATDLNSAIASANVISCATSSTRPLVHKRDVKAGTHVNLIGSYTPKMREAANALFQGARVIVDTKGAIAESGDLVDPCFAGSLDVTTIRDLPELIRDPTLGRRDTKEITIFKAAGMAAADLAVADYLVVRQAAARQNSTWNTDTLPK